MEALGVEFEERHANEFESTKITFHIIHMQGIGNNHGNTLIFQ